LVDVLTACFSSGSRWDRLLFPPCLLLLRYAAAGVGVGVGVPPAIAPFFVGARGGVEWRGDIVEREVGVFNVRR